MAGLPEFPEGYFSIKRAAQESGFSEAQLRRMDKAGKFQGQLKLKRLKFGDRQYRAFTKKHINYLRELKGDSLSRRILNLQFEIRNLYEKKFDWFEGGPISTVEKAKSRMSNKPCIRVEYLQKD